jgi:hypothetical protein
MPIHAQHGSVLSPEILGACVVVGVGRCLRGQFVISSPRVQIPPPAPLFSRTSWVLSTTRPPACYHFATLVVESIDGSLVAHRKPLSVRVDRQLDAGMSELTLDIGRALPLLEKKAGERVTPGSGA